MTSLSHQLKATFFTSENPNAYLALKDRKEFLLIVLQLILLVAFSYFFAIDDKQGFPILMGITLAAFLFNAFLPVKWRPVIHLLIFAGVCMWSLDWITGGFVIFVSIALFICADLPVKLFYRLVLIGIITAGLFILRTERFFAPRAIIAVPYIASLFMFRLISYLYYKKKIAQPAALSMRLNYFFLLPNLVFLLFPIIDYKTYTNSYYARPAIDIYRKGIYRLLTGVLLLMLHRVVYYYCAISSADVHDLSSLIYYNFISYFLIIQIVGMFQICIGWVTLFGHDLSSIFENFFLAKGFSDLWRKINHYWRDFIVKVFYFPFFFRLRTIGQYPAMIIAGLSAFFFSWMMHSQQMFWLTGTFPFSANDALYWMTMGVFITADGIYSYRTSGKTRKIHSPFISILLNGLRITGIFIFASLLWTLWNSSTVAAWSFQMTQAKNTTVASALSLAGILLVFILFAGAYNFFFKKNSLEKRDHNRYFVFPYFFNAVLLLLLVFRIGASMLPAGSRLAEISDEINITRVNDADREAVDLGYYDKLTDRGGISRIGAQLRLFGDHDWAQLNGASHSTGDIMLRVFNPNAHTTHKGYDISINHMGLRDKEYTDAKPSGTIRWAFLGTSYVLGPGVEKENSFEAVTEKTLHDSLRKFGKGGLEILNFSNGGYLLPQSVALCQDRVFKYDPDAVFYFAQPGDLDYTARNLCRLATFGIDLSKYPTLDSVAKEAGLQQSQPREEMLQRLYPYRERLLRWGYSAIAEECKRHNALPVWVFLPETTTPGTQAEFIYLSAVAREYGFIILDLRGINDGWKPSEIQVGDPDTHPNILGHRLIANKLEAEIRKQHLDVDSTYHH